MDRLKIKFIIYKVKYNRSIMIWYLSSCLNRIIGGIYIDKKINFISVCYGYFSIMFKGKQNFK